MNNTERDLRRRLKKSIRKRTELNNRWNKLKEFIDSKCEYLGDTLTYDELMIKIEELEKGDSNGN